MNDENTSLWDITEQTVREVRLVVPAGDASRALAWVRARGGTVRESGVASIGGRPDGTRFEVSASMPVMEEGAEPPAPSLTFTCVNCGGHRLECVESGMFASAVLRIDPGGDHDYGPIQAVDAEVIRYQCLDCGGNVLPPGALDDVVVDAPCLTPKPAQPCAD